MEDDERHDIREVYLAIHHMMKYRGNFLTEGELAPSSVFDVEDLLKLLTEILQYADEDETGDDLELQADANGLTEALCTPKALAPYVLECNLHSQGGYRIIEAPRGYHQRSVLPVLKAISLI